MEKENKLQSADNIETALENEADFEIQREENKLFVVRAGLLGEFDNEGKYSVDYDVLTELLDVVKIITNTTDNGYQAIAKVGEFKIKFQVKIQEEKNYFLRADLILLEDSEGLDIQPRSLSTFIASYSDINNAFFRDNVKKEFNLVTEIESLGKEIKNDELAKFTLDIKNKHKKVAAYIEMLMEVQAEIYTIRMIEVLSRAGKLGEKILSEYNVEVEKHEKTLTVGKKQVYTKLKDILDTAIKNNGGFEAVGAQNEAKVAVKEAKKVVDEYYGTFHEMIKRMPKAEKPAEKPKEEVKKPASAAPAKKGDKPKDKPKNKPKDKPKDKPKSKDDEKKNKGLFDDFSFKKPMAPDSKPKEKPITPGKPKEKPAAKPPETPKDDLYDDAPPPPPKREKKKELKAPPKPNVYSRYDTESPQKLDERDRGYY